MFQNLEEANAYIEELNKKFETSQKTAEARKKDNIELNKKISDINSRLEKFSGIDLEEMERLKTEAAQREQADLEKKGEYDKLLQKEKEAFTAYKEKTEKTLREKTEAIEAQTATNLANEKRLHNTLNFIQNGGDETQLENYLLTSDRYFDYGVAEGDEKASFRLREGLRTEKGDEITDVIEGTKFLSKNSNLSVFFKPENKSDGSNPPGGAPDGGNDGLPSGISMV